MSRRRGAAVFRDAVRELAKCNFIEAHNIVRGTRAERPIVDVIIRMVGLINERSELEDRLNNVLDYYGLEEPTQEEIDAFWEGQHDRAREEAS